MLFLDLLYLFVHTEYGILKFDFKCSHNLVSREPYTLSTHDFVSIVSLERCGNFSNIGQNRKNNGGLRDASEEKQVGLSFRDVQSMEMQDICLT